MPEQRRWNKDETVLEHKVGEGRDGAKDRGGRRQFYNKEDFETVLEQIIWKREEETVLE